jgi:hypothetical protein
MGDLDLGSWKSPLRSPRVASHRMPAGLRRWLRILRAVGELAFPGGILRAGPSTKTYRPTFPANLNARDGNAEIENRVGESGCVAGWSGIGRGGWFGREDRKEDRGKRTKERGQRKEEGFGLFFGPSGFFPLSSGFFPVS